MADRKELIEIITREVRSALEKRKGRKKEVTTHPAQTEDAPTEKTTESQKSCPDESTVCIKTDVITLDQLRKLDESVKKIILSSKALITPLAREYITEKGIVVTRN